MAADGQDPHGGLPGAVCVAADGQKLYGGLPGAVCVATDVLEPMAASKMQSVWPGTPRMDSPVKSVWLQVAWNPKDGLSGEVGVAADGQDPMAASPL